MSSIGGDDHAYIATIVATYWFVSISMVYLNKILMSSEGISIPAPLFVTWFQCVVTALICWVAGKVGEYYKRLDYKQGYEKTPTSESDDSKGAADNSTPKKPSFFAQFPKAEYNMLTAKEVFPLTLIFVGMITFNNLCLKWVEVSFYNVARSLTIVFNVIFTGILLRQGTSVKTLGCLGVVILGFLMGTNGELNFSLKGTIAGILSSMFVSLNSIFTKKVLPAVNDDHWRLCFYNNINASFLFIPLMIVFETEPLIAAVSNGQMFSGLFWAAMMVAGFFGFAIGIVTVLQIKATSPLSHNISGTAKAAVQSMLAFYIWKNPATVMGVMGIFVVLGGSLLYTLVKMNESKPVTNPDPPESPTKEDLESPLIPAKQTT
mmetsp:Transcript_6538/g.8494  ORF Transcript_6538/g.8494 Transcript_6538/m.8494 type:complete len:376 (+) Transcript_6538:149-1276(+)|eukprot:CAMPEP_0198142422 /NCGR_PEP_ID=MMETSP1443-20131203/5194_1 /TAXON_ID=186043 /ORGANISM="Entomoneis sp., Strain CCMP2396" /LENGTH=375 /DNA_ID=CAMNT_0043805419 /DNA_START=73 /DNA_END=1200 /DNA_ORIENTATION=-